jgi:NAD(P)-dependent dehydrogenase (short-subunit alcohol dehydrogenase family)
MKAAIVTGAGSGIGKAIALQLAKQGYFIYLLGRDKTKLEETALLCRSGARRYALDLTQSESITKVCADILSQQGTELKILINNAGIYAPNSHVGTQLKSPSVAESMKAWQNHFATNLFGCIEFTNHILPEFIRHKQGSIVNVSSTLGLKPTAQTSAYSASKAAMNSWTQSLALELAPHQIRVNAVCPGIVETPIHGGQDMLQWAKFQPLGRVGLASEIAAAVAFLADSESSAWTTGVLLPVDGGIQLL